MVQLLISLMNFNNSKNECMLFTSLLFCLFATAQSPTFIHNDSITFAVLRKSSEFVDNKGYEPISYKLRVKITREQREICKQISNDEWLGLLQDENTDWAANLILYDLFEKDALTYLKTYKNRTVWIQLGQRDADIKYWKNRLTKEK